ncbi:unnamed protein product [Urochloa decumbens]|uniref:Uncharacterized protein n=1 Tax=Urochloa decumbens TaxID=240449 RepID=A0ABC9BKW4_9POAL
MLRELRVPMLRAPAAAARPARRPLLKAAAALYRQVVDAVVYGYLVMVWGHSLGGAAVEIVARWTYGEGSAAEAISAAVRAACWFVMVRLFPVFSPLLLLRLYQRAEFERKKDEKEREERRGELASNGQLLKRNREEIRLPKGINVVPFFMSPHLCQLFHLATMMKHAEGDESLMWMGSVLYDVACFGLAINTGFFVQNFMILATVPKVNNGDE